MASRGTEQYEDILWLPRPKFTWTYPSNDSQDFTASGDWPWTAFLSKTAVYETEQIVFRWNSHITILSINMKRVIGAV